MATLTSTVGFAYGRFIAAVFIIIWLAVVMGDEQDGSARRWFSAGVTAFVAAALLTYGGWVHVSHGLQADSDTAKAFWKMHMLAG